MLHSNSSVRLLSEGAVAAGDSSLAGTFRPPGLGSHGLLWAALGPSGTLSEIELFQKPETT